MPKNLWTVLFIEFLVITGLVALFGASAHNRNLVWKESVSLCSDIVSKYPYNVRAHYNLGLAYLSKGEYNMALKEMRLAKKLSTPAQWKKIAKRIKKRRRPGRRHQ